MTMTMTSRFRFLPIMLLAVSLVLTVKIGTIWHGLDATFDVSAMAADGHAEASPTAANVEMTTDGGAAAPTADAVAAPPAVDDRRDLPLSEAEIGLLQQLAQRRDALDARTRATEQREALLRAAEARIDQKIGELKSMQAIVERLIKVYDEQQEAKIQSLVKIYETMKPKEAARIFEELEMETLLLVAERMKERKLAPIMAVMDPTKAKRVTIELARLRQVLPAPVPVSGRSG